MRQRFRGLKYEAQHMYRDLKSGQLPQTSAGFSLLELVITLTVLSIIIMGTIPLAQNAYKRQKELRLRETLRLVRSAIDEFKRDTYGACQQGNVTSGNPAGQGRVGANQGGADVPLDPRSRVVIDDCTIFDSENLDRYPPTLSVLWEGVKVKQRGLNVKGGRGLGKDDDFSVFDENENKEIKKYYLREEPVDPMTGEPFTTFRSSYQSKDDDTWDDVNVFDLRSSSDEEALNGEKYSDW
jgi:general secretion pathway protein G